MNGEGGWLSGMQCGKQAKGQRGLTRVDTRKAERKRLMDVMEPRGLILPPAPRARGGGRSVGGWRGSRVYRVTVDKGKIKRLPPCYIFHEDRGRTRVWRRCGFGGYLSRETDDGVPPTR